MPVSVVVPTYNRASTLMATVENILAQSMPPAEVIVVDDASTDHTAALVAEFPSQVRYLQHATNKGAGAARNTGVAACQYDLVAFQDSDDLWQSDKLAKQLAVHTARPDLDICFTGVEVHYGDSGRVSFFAADKVLADNIIDVLDFPYCPGTWLFKRDWFLRLGGFDEQLESMEDWDLLARMLSQQASRYLLAEPLLIKSHEREDSLDAQADKQRRSHTEILGRFPELWAPLKQEQLRRLRGYASHHRREGDRPAMWRALRYLLAAQPINVRSWGAVARLMMLVTAEDLGNASRR